MGISLVIQDGVVELFYYSSRLQSKMEWHSYFIILPSYNERWSGTVIIKIMNGEIDGQNNETTDTCFLELLLTTQKGEIDVQLNGTTDNCYFELDKSPMV